MVTEDSVFVTAAFLTGKGQALKRGATLGVLAGAVLLAIATIPLVLRCCQAEPVSMSHRLLPVVCFSVLTGLLVYSTLYVWLFYSGGHAGRFFRWGHSGAAGAVCLMLACVPLAARSPLRLLIAAIAILGAGFVVYGRPDPEYYHLGLGAATPLHCTVAVLLGVAFVILLRAILRRGDRPDHADAPTRRQATPASWVCPALAGAAFLIGSLGFGAIPLLNVAKTCYKLIFDGNVALPSELHGAGDRLLFLLGHRNLGRPLLPVLVTNAGFLLWLVMELGNLRPRGMPRLRWLPLGFLCLAALSFFTTNYLGIKQEFVRAIVCVDRNTGRVRWIREGLRGDKAPTSHWNSAATPTPVVEGNRVYAYFGSPGLMCTDLEGDLLWTRTDLPFEGIHGVGASPVLCDGLLLLSNAMAKAPYIVALDCKTGKTVWNVPLSPWPGTHGQHRTPLVVTANGKSAVLFWSGFGETLAAYDVRSGEELWGCPLKSPPGGEAVASILSDGDTLYLPYKMSFRALSLSKLARGEDPIKWTVPMKGKGPNTASPLLHNGMLFMVSDDGYATCLDAETGTVLWQERLSRSHHLASPIGIGGLVYFPDTSGATTVVACEPEFRKVAQNLLPDPIYASFAPVDGQLFIRTTRELWCMEELQYCGIRPATLSSIATGQGCNTSSIRAKKTQCSLSR